MYWSQLPTLVILFPFILGNHPVLFRLGVFASQMTNPPFQKFYYRATQQFSFLVSWLTSLTKKVEKVRSYYTAIVLQLNCQLATPHRPAQK